jgi:galacturan 1,4-alpha-galacturonidase
MRRGTRLACILGALLSAQLAIAGISKRATCTLESSGGDDAPALASAITSKSCFVVEIPVGTTLNIASPLKTTATYNKHISLKGTISFTNDTVRAFGEFAM